MSVISSMLSTLNSTKLNCDAKCEAFSKQAPIIQKTKDIIKHINHVMNKTTMTRYKYTSTKEEINSNDFYKYFVKINYEVLNNYGTKISGGERSEFNLLSELESSGKYELLLIDEPESSFDNLFLKNSVDELLKDQPVGLYDYKEVREEVKKRLQSYRNIYNYYCPLNFR